MMGNRLLLVIGECAMSGSKKCWHPGCDEKGMRCVLIWRDPDEIPYERYCHNHAFDNGYCYGCGIFQAGIERFDFGPYKGLCDNCGAEAEASDHNYYDEEMDYSWQRENVP
jgi:hypothetical protein